MNELDLRRLQEEPAINHLEPNLYSWRELIGGKIYGMIILFKIF